MRRSKVNRETKETRIYLEIEIDGNGQADIELDYPFFRHMFVTLAKFSEVDIKLVAKGDLPHHLIEDIGITLGTALDRAVNRELIKRFGYSVIPMDEALVLCSLDMVRRPYFSYNLNMQGNVEFEPLFVEHFFRSLAYSAPMTLHLYQFNGRDPHHIAEAAFKSFGLSLKQAVELSNKSMSVKGSL
ncbi:MAG: imidazoleglycerol-phosphate dehydratase HisB [Nitrososphaeria archaeon]|nr:imidazoleglycerol-phosphate dehydratase HisB [Conexivisphaerales archaeon]